MKTRNLWMGLILLTAVVSSAGWAVTRTVDDDGPADFATIQPAINASVAGDTVFVKPGTYDGPIVMKGGVNLLGYGPHVTTITGNNTAIHVVSFDSPTPTILSGFRIINSVTGDLATSWSYGGVYVASGPITIRNNIIEHNHAGIAVMSGNPTIINNTIVNNMNGVIFAGDAGHYTPSTTVAFIYDTDLAGAKAYGSFLRSNGVDVDLIPLNGVGRESLAGYRAILIGTDTGDTATWGTDTAVTAIVKSGRPVIAMGEGGYAFLGKLELATGYPHGIHSDNTTGLYVVDLSSAFFNFPNDIPIPKSRLLSIYERSGSVEIHLDAVPRNVEVIGRDSISTNYYLLTRENNRYMFWGFTGGAEALTRAGGDLLVNVVRNLSIICFPTLPDPILQATGSEPGSPGYTRYTFRVTNWYAYPDEMFEPAPDLPPCGINPNASRTWVDIYNAETHERVYGFCALGQAHNLHDSLSVSFPTGETPPPVYITMVDRRCDAAYTSNAITLRDEPYFTHTIMNNIIVDNVTGIFYYAFLNEGRILYNDVWSNSYRDYHDNNAGSTFVPQPGTGEISANPLFADALYRLTDASPCKDTGNPAVFYNDPDGTRNDMGAYGGPSASGQGLFSGSGFIFTSVGNIPTSEIVQDTALTTLGLANVDATTAAALGIPAYVDAPFGSSLYINGLFGDVDIANGVRAYQILLGKWTGNTPPDEDTGYTALTDALYKIKYTPQGDGSVLTELVNLGAKTIKGIPNCYELTYHEWWSNLDLRVIWNTTVVPNGKYTLKCRAFRDSPMIPGLMIPYSPMPNDLDHFTVMVNNTFCEASINKVMYDPSSPNYIPANDGEIPACGMIDLMSDTENLRFNITARHPDGYLWYWVLDAYYGKNQYAGRIAQSWYPGVTPPNNWPGVTDAEFSSSAAVPPILWKNCAYQFYLVAYSRITNGFDYLYSKPYAADFSDHYYLKVGDCAWCNGADINRDSKVNLADFAVLASQWMQTSCGPACAID
jgi:parallel beta-helix repeat protein